MAQFVEVLTAVLEHAAQTNANLFLIEIGGDEFRLDRSAQKPNEPVLGAGFDRSEYDPKSNDGEVHPRGSPVSCEPRPIFRLDSGVLPPH